MTSSWTIRKVGSWSELEGLPGFRQEPVSVALMVAGELVQDYDMPIAGGMKPCGIVSCSTPHRKGYIVRLADGTVSHIGNKCGKRWFDADWSQQLSRYRERRNAAARTLALQDAREHALSVARQPLRISETALRAALSMKAAYDALPSALRDSLQARASGGDTTLLAHRPPNLREIGEAKEKKKPIPVSVLHPVGKLKGLAALRPSNHPDAIMARLASKAQALELQSTRTDVRAEDLRESARSLEASRGDFEVTLRQWAAFFEPDNLAQLVHLRVVQEMGVGAVRVDGPPSYTVLLDER